MRDVTYDPVIANLHRTLTAALQVVNKLAEQDQNSPSPLIKRIASKQHDSKIRSEWLRVGGEDFVPAARTLFETPEFLTRYVPGATRSCYIAHCTGLGMIAKAIDRSAFKISTTGAGLVQDRMWQSQDDVHAGAHRSKGIFVTDAPNWSNWQPAFPRLANGPSPGSPVSIGARSIDIALPATMTPEEFDRCFDAQTRKAALHEWADTPACLAHCAHRGVDPDALKRWTVYPRRSGMKPSRARELCIFRQSRDSDRLVEIIERIVLKHLGLVA